MTWPRREACLVRTGGGLIAVIGVSLVAGPRDQPSRTGSAVLAMLPDTGERYLSTALFEGVNQGSDAV